MTLTKAVKTIELMRLYVNNVLLYLKEQKF